MELKRIGPLSAGKILGVMGFIVGLLMGVFTIVVSMATSAYFGDSFRNSSIMSAVFGIGSILVMPFIYGIIGFLQGLVGAWLYNLIAQFLGGVHLDLE
ncbi:MAG: hypothetical protein P8Z42_07875 [Anaerolineales bacterium]